MPATVLRKLVDRMAKVADAALRLQPRGATLRMVDGQAYLVALAAVWT